MSATFGTVDFGFRPIRPEEDYSGMECGEEDPPHGSSLAHPHASGATFRVAEDEADDLFISDTETLPDSTGFGARQRLINEQQRVAAAAAERAAPGPFLGSTLTELCESYGAIAAASSTPCDVWAEVITTLREREAAKRAVGARPEDGEAHSIARPSSSGSSRCARTSASVRPPRTSRCSTWYVAKRRKKPGIARAPPRRARLAIHAPRLSDPGRARSPPNRTR